MGYNKKDKKNGSKRPQHHWVIIRDDGKAIFGYPLRTEEEALATIKFEELTDYSAERRSNNKHIINN